MRKKKLNTDKEYHTTEGGMENVVLLEEKRLSLSLASSL